MRNLRKTGFFYSLLFNLRRTVDEVVFPEFVGWILDQLDEGDQQSPWMWTVHNQTFEQYARDLLLEIKKALTIIILRLLNLFLLGLPQSSLRRRGRAAHS
jgi:hypothetical protein